MCNRWQHNVPPSGPSGFLYTPSLQLPNQHRLAIWLIAGCGCVCSTADVLALWLVVMLDALAACYSLTKLNHKVGGSCNGERNPVVIQKRENGHSDLGSSHDDFS